MRWRTTSPHPSGPVARRRLGAVLAAVLVAGAVAGLFFTPALGCRPSVAAAASAAPPRIVDLLAGRPQRGPDQRPGGPSHGG